MKQTFRAEIQNMGKNEILEMVPPDTINRIKKTDPKPEIKVFGLGGEGKSKGKIVNIGAKVVNYLRDAVLKFFDRLKIGTAIFNQHTETNEHTGREQIGELIGKALKTIKGKLLAIGAVYIYPQYKRLPLDVASVEADIEYSGKGEEVKVENVEQITGIALSSSTIEQPGFPGATLLGAMQAFNSHQVARRAMHNSVRQGGKMTIEEIKQAIEDGNLKPSDVFSKETLRDDPAVKDIVKEEKQTEYEHARRVEKKLGEERDERMKLEKEKEEKITGLTSKLLQAKAQGILDSLAGERNLTEQQTKFITKNFGTFKTEAKDEAGLKTDLNKFIDTQIEEFKDTAKLFGVEEEEDRDKGKDKGNPPGDGEGMISKEDYENPDKNPFIAGGKAATGK